jgi:hypothetical protein
MSHTNLIFLVNRPDLSIYTYLSPGVKRFESILILYLNYDLR